MPKSLRLALALAIFIAGVAWVEYDIGWSKLLSAWSVVPLRHLLALSLLTLLSYLLRAWRVFYFFGKPLDHPFRHYLRISLLHNALNNLLPMRLGEASFPLMMKQTLQLPLLQTSAGLIWIRLADLHFLLVLLSIALALSFGPAYWSLTAALLIAPVLVARFGPALQKRLPLRLQRLLQTILPYLPASAGRGAVLYLNTVAIWCSKLLALTLVMLAFIPMPFTEALMAVITADLSSVLPIHGLAGSGTFEAAILLALLPFGIQRELILIAAVNVHIYLLGLTLLSIPVALLIPGTGSAGTTERA